MKPAFIIRGRSMGNPNAGRKGKTLYYAFGGWTSHKKDAERMSEVAVEAVISNRKRLNQSAKVEDQIENMSVVLVSMSGAS